MGAALLLTACSVHRNKQSAIVPSVTAPVLKNNPLNKETRKSGSDHKIKPWVSNLSKPFKATEGLEGHHLSIWASHGRYFDLTKGVWEWQRPYLFETREDLFTQTFVVPYIIPMLENAGAVVFTPRERDWQTKEVIVDNNASKGFYQEGNWHTIDSCGFAMPEKGILFDNENPFRKGSYNQTFTTKDNATACAIYKPTLPEEGDYAVYVSYHTLPNSVNDAQYTVLHGGQKTKFSINQCMGGGTWVYLGTFHFTQSDSLDNAVVLENTSSERGIVTTDAVRFGGGMGNIARASADSIATVSGLPRANEGARYYCQWAGAPYFAYSVYEGTDDYKDDINSRSNMLNWLAGGSKYLPDTLGQHVPIELSLAIHSDAGFHPDHKSIYGTLGICTTDANAGMFVSGASRQASTTLRDSVLNSVCSDLARIYGNWPLRERRDQNYSETRRPEVPSTILEMFSHQSAPDMILGHDPLFKFSMSRAVYKAVARFIAASHSEKCTIAPLAPQNLRTSIDTLGTLTINWDEQKDSLEPTAVPTSYIIYIATGDGDYDNGHITPKRSFTMTLEEGRVTRFRVAALNKGGRSMPSEELAAVYFKSAPRVLVVNGFHRLASPQVVALTDSIGETSNCFDIEYDAGLSYGKTPAWSRYGYVAGNDFNYVASHVDAIAAAHCTAISCAASALSEYNLQDYKAVDLLLGNERNDGYSLYKGKAITESMCQALRHYKGMIIASGSYIGSDSSDDTAHSFLSDRLGVRFNTQNRSSIEELHGMGLDFEVYRKINDRHYASAASDVLYPVGDAFAVMAYSDDTPAAVVKKDSSFVMGFPFECIKQRSDRQAIMRAILSN